MDKEEVFREVERYVQEKYAFNEAEYNRMRGEMRAAQYVLQIAISAVEGYNAPLAHTLKAEAKRCGWYK